MLNRIKHFFVATPHNMLSANTDHTLAIVAKSKPPLTLAYANSPSSCNEVMLDKQLLGRRHRIINAHARIIQILV
jgi:hypothetical protein